VVRFRDGGMIADERQEPALAAAALAQLSAGAMAVAAS
jgi:hypothetical protein